MCTDVGRDCVVLGFGIRYWEGDVYRCWEGLCSTGFWYQVLGGGCVQMLGGTV